MAAVKITKAARAAKAVGRRISEVEKAEVPAVEKAVRVGTEAAAQIVLIAEKAIISAKRTEAVRTARTLKTKKTTLIQAQGGRSLRDLPMMTLTDSNQHSL